MGKIALNCLKLYAQRILLNTPLINNITIYFKICNIFLTNNEP